METAAEMFITFQPLHDWHDAHKKAQKCIAMVFRTKYKMRLLGLNRSEYA